MRFQIIFVFATMLSYSDLYLFLISGRAVLGRGRIIFLTKLKKLARFTCKMVFFLSKFIELVDKKTYSVVR